MKKPLILHITPNLPGGLGRVLHSTLNFSKQSESNFSHEIIVTDIKNINKEVIERFSEYSNSLYLAGDEEFIRNKITDADIIQIEYWNHPLVYKFLHSFNFPKSRVILCSHNNGLSRPKIITKDSVDFCDIFLALTKATKDHPLFTQKNSDNYKKKLRFAKYPVDFERFHSVNCKIHEGFNIGYVGTLDYSKIHKDFISMSSSIAKIIPNSKFIVCGNGSDEEKLKLEAINHKSINFEFSGFIENVKDILENLDVFGYPLNSTHFGSGEQALIEAMYVGLPVVTFSNPPEKEIIINNETGIIVDSKSDYVKAIKFLYDNPEERRRIGRNAKEYITNEFRPNKCFKDFEKIYFEVMKLKKTVKNFNRPINNCSKNNDLGARLFIQSLGDSGNEFLQSYENNGEIVNEEINTIISNTEISMKVKTKGSIFQYLYFFPDDRYLNFWAGLISLVDKNILENLHFSLPKTALECFEKAKKNNDNYEFNYYFEKVKKINEKKNKP